MLKANKRSTRKKNEICSKLMIKTPKRKFTEIYQKFTSKFSTTYIFSVFILLVRQAKRFADSVGIS